jgi:hypothetical protein
MESEISGLEDLHAFLKHQNFVTRFSFPYLDLPSTKTQFEPRELPGEKLNFDPRTLRKLNVPEQPAGPTTGSETAANPPSQPAPPAEAARPERPTQAESDPVKTTVTTY